MSLSDIDLEKYLALVVECHKQNMHPGSVLPNFGIRKGINLEDNADLVACSLVYSVNKDMENNRPITHNKVLEDFGFYYKISNYDIPMLNETAIGAYAYISKYCKYKPLKDVADYNLHLFSNSSR